MDSIRNCAPTGDEVVDYDRRNLALYAALIEAADAGRGWQETVADVMRLDPTDLDAEACWRSHLDRARWIVGDGMAAALEAFGKGRTPIV
ncbi:hypothetical protein C1T17_04770 [Sphingobium sp. SCG-1]|uniref:hypothetical protein n=1 Tax=Sphingobium sp. SCG-1 TaxID=2072936 RepID=UPI000CD6C134|nr:hypothetical protein [Sphingobium sp. SCG-1]AUW57521.1 hypothetical protein C1T17_04770 [Sphingobium sp. SCG-1]